MMTIYSGGLARGTQKNRLRQAYRYVSFMRAHHLPPTAPDEYDILQFATYLTHMKLSPQSTANAISGAKCWVREAGGEVRAFESHALTRLKRGLNRQTKRVITQAPALQPALMISITKFLLQVGPPAYTPLAALLTAYFTLIRQSNLVSPSPNIWHATHVLKRGDITPHPKGLSVRINSSKTITSHQQSVSLLLPSIPGSILCPVAAWSRAVTCCPAPLEAPAFMSSPQTPLDQRTLTQILRGTLSALGVKNFASYTLHSLRRGGAQACHALKVPPEAIKAQGTWESDAVFNYIPRQAPTEAPVALAAYFGRATGPLK